MMIRAMVAVLALAFAAGVARGQIAGQSVSEPRPAPTATQPVPATMPADAVPLAARVIEVRGDVRHAPLGSDDWQPCALDDAYPPETKIQTGIRSSVKLQLGEEEPFSVVMIEQVGLTLLGELYKTQDVKRVRIGVGYGRIRAGVAEGGLKSDFTVDSPVATLSKRGTWNFSLYYERDTDRFEASLLDRGLVDVLNKLNLERRRLGPGQFVTDAMRRWLDDAQIVRNVAVPDWLGQGDIEIVYNRLNVSGLGVVSPGNNQLLLINLTSSSSRRTFQSELLNQNPTLVPGLPTPPTIGPFLRPEGFFGTGRGDELIDLLITENSPLAQKRLAEPGRYRFRRSAVEQWLRENRR